MCGIAGILALSDGAPATTRQALEGMIGMLRHRGPDGYGFHVDGPVGLAHARLTVIDFATGAQPMANEDRSIWTVFNGEIFNYPELRAELEQAGHIFATRSDTETIVHAYEEFGERFVERLNGQFAIAVWDSKRRRLLLARDRLGIRPLFYSWDRGRLVFASEVKAIGQAASQGLKLDLHGLAQIFTFWSTIEARTAFADVLSLPPGHLLSVENGEGRLTRYWDWDFSPAAGAAAPSREEAAEELKALLVDAVRLQLRADVPVGAYLSGGLDSCGIVSLIRGYTGNSLRTFSVSFEDAEFDESAHQQEMVRYLGTDHTTIRCTRKDIGERFPKLIWHTESPLVRTAPVPLMMLSGIVHDRGYRVVLTGEGADEVFGGYDLFKEGKVRRFWARQPDSRWRASLFGRLYPYLRHSPVGNAAFASNFFGQGITHLADPGYAHGTRWATTKRLWNFFSADVRDALGTANVESDLAHTLPAAFANWEGLARDQYVEAKTLLAGYLLSSQGDRVGMAHSVEGRVPFLDHRVVEFANRLPARYRLSALKEKAILRKALTGLLPDGILERRKQPYRAPDAPSFFCDGKPLPYVEDLLSSDRVRRAGYFEPTAVSRLVEKCRVGKAIGFGDNMALVGILSTMLVDEIFVRQEVTAVPSI